MRLEVLEARDVPSLFDDVWLGNAAPVFDVPEESVVAFVNDDMTPDVVTVAGAGGGPRILVRDGADGSVLADEFVFEDSFRGGLDVSVVSTSDGRVAGREAKPDTIVVTGGIGAGPRVLTISFDGELRITSSVFSLPYDPETFRGGLQVSSAGSIAFFLPADSMYASHLCGVDVATRSLVLSRYVDGEGWQFSSTGGAPYDPLSGKRVVALENPWYDPDPTDAYVPTIYVA